jgi:hypothetical protein
MPDPAQVSIAKSDFSLRTALVVPPIIFQVSQLKSLCPGFQVSMTVQVSTLSAFKFC